MAQHERDIESKNIKIIDLQYKMAETPRPITRPVVELTIPVFLEEKIEEYPKKFLIEIKQLLDCKIS